MTKTTAKPITWFRTMPEPYQTAAIDAIKMELRRDKDTSYITDDCDSIGDAISRFEWSSTNIDDECWEAIYDYSAEHNGDMSKFNWPEVVKR